MNLEKTKQLLELCKNKPYVVKGSVDDYLYSSIAKENQEFFLIDNRMIWSMETLISFWINELIAQLNSSPNKKVKKEEFINQGLESFRYMFNYSHPFIDLKYFNLPEQDLMDIPGYAMMHIEGISVEQTVYIFIRERILGILPIGIEYNFHEQNFKIKETTAKFKILDEVNLILQSSPSDGKNLRLLLHELNRSPKEFEIEKPIQEEILLKLLLTDRKSFEFNQKLVYDSMNTENLIVKTKGSANEYSGLMNLPRIKLNDFKGNIAGYAGPALYAVFFEGKVFPLKEAVEYVKLRPLIYVSTTKNLSNILNQLLNPKNIIKNDLFLTIGSLLYEELDFRDFSKKDINKKISEWILDNLSLINIHSSEYGHRESYYDIIKQYNPILNRENSANLFSNLLQEKIMRFVEECGLEVPVGGTR